MKKTSVALLLLLGCGIPATDRQEFVHLFMHKPGEYSVMIREGNQMKDVMLDRATIVVDVPEGEPLWYSNRNGIFIHVSENTKINGGGFEVDEGTQKHPNIKRVQTVPIK
jgi:hypothetical protein